MCATAFFIFVLYAEVAAPATAHTKQTVESEEVTFNQDVGEYIFAGAWKWVHQGKGFDQQLAELVCR